MSDAAQFLKAMTLRARYVTKNSDRIVADVAKNVIRGLAFRTPVLTSRARANWQTQVSYPALGVLYPKPDKPETPDTGGHEAYERGIEAIEEMHEGRRTIWIVNNLYYIADLARGSSDQQPTPGWIERIFQEAKNETEWEEGLLSKPLEGESVK